MASNEDPFSARGPANDSGPPSKATTGHAPGGATGEPHPDAKRQSPARRAPVDEPADGLSDAMGSAKGASTIAIPRPRSLPIGLQHAAPGGAPKRSRLEVAASAGPDMVAPERTRPKPPRPASPVRPPTGAMTTQRPLLPTRLTAPSGARRPTPVMPPKIERPREPLLASNQPRSNAEGKRRATDEPSAGAGKVQKALKATATEKKTSYTGPDADMSEQEKMHSAYTRRLIHGLQDKTINGKRGPAGIMSECNSLGEPNLPYEHQRKAVKKMVDPKQKLTLLGHDMGLGKTATALQAIAGELCVIQRRPKVLISVPSATMDQWFDGRADWLGKIDESRVLCTNQLKKVTAETLRDKDIVVISRDCLALAFSRCYSRQEVTRETEKGARKCMEWLRTPATTAGESPHEPLHALYDPLGTKHAPVAGWHGIWDLFIVDECAPDPTSNPDTLCHACLTRARVPCLV